MVSDVRKPGPPSLNYYPKDEITRIWQFVLRVSTWILKFPSGDKEEVRNFHTLPTII